MKSVTSSPSTWGPITTPHSSSATTVGIRIPRPASIAASVPATAAVATIARNEPGLTGTSCASSMRDSLTAPRDCDITCKG